MCNSSQHPIVLSAGKPLPSSWSPHSRQTRVCEAITLVEHKLRNSIDAALGTESRSYHAHTLEEAANATQGLAVGTLILSPGFLGDVSLPSIRSLLADCPGFRVLAVVAEMSSTSGQSLLSLGALGVPIVIDLSVADGWQKLRSSVDYHDSETGRAILQAIMPVLSDSTEAARKFFGCLIRQAPAAITARQLCRSIDQSTQTLQSRFFRAGLPSLRTYLAMVRLTHLAAMLENSSVSIAAASTRLGCSSPQSLSRHVQFVIGMSPGQFRSCYTFQAMLDRLASNYFARYRGELKYFEPYGRS